MDNESLLSLFNISVFEKKNLQIYKLKDVIFITECLSGTFGPNCYGTCGNCFNGTSCNRETGACVLGCAAGFTGGVCKTGSDALSLSLSLSLSVI